MSYQTPKTNWDSDYVPNHDDMNRIEGNIKFLSGLCGGNLAVAVSLDVGIEYEYLKLTAASGGLNIKHISTAGKFIGSRLLLQFPSNYSVLVYNLAGSIPSGYANIYLGGSDLSFQTSIKEFIYDGTSWFII